MPILNDYDFASLILYSFWPDHCCNTSWPWPSATGLLQDCKLNILVWNGIFSLWILSFRFFAKADIIYFGWENRMSSEFVCSMSLREQFLFARYPRTSTLCFEWGTLSNPLATNPDFISPSFSLQTEIIPLLQPFLRSRRLFRSVLLCSSTGAKGL